MVTSQQIKEKLFSVKFRGYDQEEVDIFLDEIVETLNSLEQENQSLKRQIKRLKSGDDYLL
ncbi:DivIVA domain-containing protein [Streptococcus orisasini]|uniref:DivIVA domain-containing protein n=1 Tax=Streptococcus orisasini TaxID=1080071 RepID=UPI00070DC9BA|nr:DivIVA domain-containing protein [Streptococcus orisasini]